MDTQATETQEPLRFVRCVMDGCDLVCTPWDYNRDGSTRQGEPVRIANALRIKARRVGLRTYNFVGFTDDTETLRRVCELAGHGPENYCLRATESGRSWSLELRSGYRLWRVG